MALGDSSVWYLPAGSSTCRPAQSSRRPRSAAIAATSTSVKSQVAWPAQAEPPGAADLALMSALPLGWSWRSRSPLEVPRKVLVSECSAYPYSFRPAAARGRERLAERRREGAEHADAGAARLVVPAGLSRFLPCFAAERLPVGWPEQLLRIFGRGTPACGALGRGNHVRHLVARAPRRGTPRRPGCRRCRG